jgi:hypothetical protein
MLFRWLTLDGKKVRWGSQQKFPERKRGTFGQCKSFFPDELVRPSSLLQPVVWVALSGRKSQRRWGQTLICPNPSLRGYVLSSRNLMGRDR